MAFALKAALSVSFTPDLSITPKGGLRMSTWAEQAAQRLANEETEQRERESATTSKSARIRGEAPYLWEALRQALQANVVEFKTLRPGFLEIDPLIQHLTTLRLRSTGKQRELVLSFDANVPVLTYTLNQFSDAYSHPKPEKGRFSFDARPDNTDSMGTWFIDNSGRKLSVAELAEVLLNLLIE
jgi:hypothetical protein